MHTRDAPVAQGTELRSSEPRVAGSNPAGRAITYTVAILYEAFNFMLISRISKLIISLLKILVLLLIALSVTSALVPQVRSAFKTTAFILQVIESPVKPLDFFMENPIREEVRFPQSSGEGLADFYRPSRGGRHSAVLLFLGVNPAGRNDARVVNLAESLTKSGMVVMIPWSQSMTE